ncbi:histidinol phosphatase [Longilinea arvoryzae]|uniref:Histidinol phosphatase n=1 Tax=Longilinea arvoryzae TaxID=360412 RepID=A0A0S7BNT6_9CHLR|nr:PHP domain-containing protein [Longilinea arvoryzae]GAP15509.1 histidinol phosphatase [Longilinea arvoryzae]
MRVDLHVHDRDRSPCATDTDESQVRTAIAAGLEGLAFTNHFRLVPDARLAELRRDFSPFRIFSGIEITADQEDWLVLGLREGRLERRDWDYPSLWRFVRDQGGFIALAHPFRWASCIHADLGIYPPDAIEVRSNNTPPARESEIRSQAERYGLALLCDSDAHSNGMIGKYWNDLPGAPQTDDELLDSLRQFARIAHQATPAD